MPATYHTVVQDRWWFPGQRFLSGCFNEPLAFNRHKNKWYDAQKLQRISSEGRQHNVTNEKYSLRRESFCQERRNLAGIVKHVPHFIKSWPSKCQEKELVHNLSNDINREELSY